MTATEATSSGTSNPGTQTAVQTIEDPNRTLEEIAAVRGDIEQYHLTEFNGEQPPRPGHPAGDRL